MIFIYNEVNEIIKNDIYIEWRKQNYKGWY